MELTPVALYLLVTLDSLFCGYRAAAGRSALIDKRAYYRRAMSYGALAGQAVVALAAVAVGVILFRAPAPAERWRELLSVGGRLLTVYVPYALALGAAFALRAIPSVDVKSLTSTLVFGPLTLLRPLVIVAGLAWGAAAVPRPEVVALCLLAALMMLSLERALGRRFRHRLA